MGVLKAFAVCDTKVGVYQTPFFVKHTAQALRSWTTACNDNASPMAQFPSDYALHEVGSFDEDKGVFVGLERPHHVSNALDVLKRNDAQLPLSAIK